MVGYPESLTDPSYRGQILVLTFPLIGNYGVPSVEEQVEGLSRYFESSQIHIAALIVGEYSHDFSHYLARSSLSEWLKKSNVPALYGIDTRALTKKIRTNGVLLGKVQFPQSRILASHLCDGEMSGTAFESLLEPVPLTDPNQRHLVAEVSTKVVKHYAADASRTVKRKNGKPLHILALDLGMVTQRLFEIRRVFFILLMAACAETVLSVCRLNSGVQDLFFIKIKNF
jgi:carbamoyl-phosphate synthase/aspartate carbamoyltransferase